MLQDETSVTPGVEHQLVLAPVGYKQPIYNRGGDSRQHTSLSVMVPADGKHVLIRMVYKGKRKMASMTTGIPTTGKNKSSYIRVKLYRIKFEL